MANVILCGFMGSGKSTVGRLLAKELHCPFVDMDDYIELVAGQKIPAIFAKYGEAAFRQLEHEAVLRLCCHRGMVISTGGGTVLQQQNLQPLKTSGRIVLLDTAFEHCYERIQGSDRPLLKANTPESFRALYEQRLPVYRAACDLRVENHGTPLQTAQAIAAALAE